VLYASPPTLHVVCVQTGTGVRRMRGPVENVLLAIFFMQLSKRETRPHIVRLLFHEKGDVHTTSVSPFS
jgi:hypothetical protein